MAALTKAFSSGSGCSNGFQESGGAIRLHVQSVAKWLATGATNTPAFKDAVATLEYFYDVEEGGPNTAAFIHAWAVARVWNPCANAKDVSELKATLAGLKGSTSAAGFDRYWRSLGRR